MSVVTFTLPYASGPPLRSNKRLHWRVEHNLKKDIRLTGKVQALNWMNAQKDATFPLPGLVEVVMTWHVPTRHRRDASSGMPTIKSYVDGLVDAGLLHDDSWVWVSEERCQIQYAPGEPMSLTVEVRETK